MHVAERSPPDDQLQTVHEAEYILLACALQLERNDGAVQSFRQQAPDDGGVGMTGIGQVMHARDPWMRAEPRRDAASISALAFHPERKGVDTAHREVALEGAEDGPHGPAQRAN